MKHGLLYCLVLACLVFPYTSSANSTLKTNITEEEEKQATQLQLGDLPPIDVGVAVSGSSHKFMRFDRIADKLQKAGQSIENGGDAQQAARDARLNGRLDKCNVDPELAPSEGKANQQGHKALGVALQTNF